ncbi:hydroxymethylglutaryl-CoA lyase [Chitinophaga sp. GCM10012297]|uniref:Hydroxymethylglutaryl-CoA lyase n=1 Tax=Chitinophaga chungangae TaxID=2821488 RepID=A0ABS3YA81_9BACT|nr:hydroxymethylglutaryl-CoA lyase [Chitinophaga chungangae]MBO9151588.1 hydroxymethylglutaryl-CoA lyase [Chitinophaga chungangae]
MLKFIECPRDAMQGWPRQIPANEKIGYLNALLDVGFDTLDFGSFVSAKAVPQMADTAEVMKGLKPSSTKLLAIVANVRGAEEAVGYDAISYLGFPFSIAETFQLRNTNKTIAEAMEQVQAIQELCLKNNKQLVIYISMGFGNPYGDPYSTDTVLHWAGNFAELNIPVISLADTVGVAEPEGIAKLFSHLVPAYPDIEFGAHFHSTPQLWKEKIAAAYDNGCRRFDSAIRGIGGCPFAQDDLVGNIATENLVHFCNDRKLPVPLNLERFAAAGALADKVFNH